MGPLEPRVNFVECWNEKKKNVRDLILTDAEGSAGPVMIFANEDCIFRGLATIGFVNGLVLKMSEKIGKPCEAIWWSGSIPTMGVKITLLKSASSPRIQWVNFVPVHCLLALSVQQQTEAIENQWVLHDAPENFYLRDRWTPALEFSKFPFNYFIKTGLSKFTWWLRINVLAGVIALNYV